MLLKLELPAEDPRLLVEASKVDISVAVYSSDVASVSMVDVSIVDVSMGDVSMVDASKAVDVSMVTDVSTVDISEVVAVSEVIDTSELVDFSDVVEVLILLVPVYEESVVAVEVVDNAKEVVSSFDVGPNIPCDVESLTGAVKDDNEDVESASDDVASDDVGNAAEVVETSGTGSSLIAMS